jgi:AcrR family transcriptional regulator
MGKGEETRQSILGHALRLASSVGLEGLTIGDLAGQLGLSKSGLFAHFRSKEKLQIAVLEAAAELFVSEVVQPAIRESRGAPRVRALFDRWLAWSQASGLPGGCLFVAAAAELDDRPGPVRDALVHLQRQWIGTLTRAAALAVEAKHFRQSLDPEQFAFEMYALMLGAHHFGRLLHDPNHKRRTHFAFAALLDRAQTPGS